MVDKNVKNFILVDGSSYLYRAYYALPHLKNKDGDHTGALYGVSNMLSKLIRSYNPAFLCVVFDAKGKNFRHKIYDEYKANRSSMPVIIRTSSTNYRTYQKPRNNNFTGTRSRGR